ncbi:rcc01693 family protein [Roseovarius rhodophyticola]|uniref:Rcc01693 family protein n=1 Tax=Roseovarius rhodophyticola TaxID=3080827 RepID=A0ABZ2TF68_9RHOB|nr:rcc01693 family protein [Roseovarius sp. W115]MDV2928584.1 phage tail assembly chaperone [Roseovarius sp. W115]
MSGAGAERFDWVGLMQAGIGMLRLSPAAFWALTPAEFELMLGKPAGFRPLRRARFEQLLSAYPDEQNEVKDG